MGEPAVNTPLALTLMASSGTSQTATLSHRVDRCSSFSAIFSRTEPPPYRKRPPFPKRRVVGFTPIADGRYPPHAQLAHPALLPFPHIRSHHATLVTTTPPISAESPVTALASPNGQLVDRSAKALGMPSSTFPESSI